MSRSGLTVAQQFGVFLPEYSSVGEAEINLYRLRDEALQEITFQLGESLRLDFSAESLKRLERWYFENGCPQTFNSGGAVAAAVGFYFGETLCRAGQFAWMVKEFAFAKSRYEIGVSRALLSVMLTNGRALSPARNKKMQSLWREFAKYVPVEGMDD